MYPNPNSWIIIKALDDERLRRAQKERQFRTAVRRRTREAWTGTNLFSKVRQQIESIRFKLRPVEERGCSGSCMPPCITAIASSV